jgi:hypothetical protein
MVTGSWHHRSLVPDSAPGAAGQGGHHNRVDSTIAAIAAKSQTNDDWTRGVRRPAPIPGNPM